MNKFCLISIIFLISAASAAGAGEPYPAVYKGYVTIDGIPATTASVMVYDSSCNKPPQEFLFDNGSYTMQVAWYDSTTPGGVSAGEAITFQVNGINAITLSVTEADTTSPRSVNLDIKSSVPTPCVIKDDKINGGGGGVSSGGGGGVISAEPFENIMKKESKDGILAKDVSKTFSFTILELPVSQIAIISNINTETISVQVELLKNRSTLVKEDAPGNVYEYLNIWVGTSGFAVPKNIKEAVVKFKLESSRITSKGFTDADITLLKWDGTQWVSLVTEKTNSDDKYTYYEAKTNAFSPFAISGVKGTTVSTAAPEVAEVTTEKPETPAPTKKAPGFGFVIAIAGLMAVVLRKRSN